MEPMTNIYDVMSFFKSRHILQGVSSHNTPLSYYAST